MINVGEAIEEAATCYRSGRLDEAERICMRLLKTTPNLFDALHLVGLVKFAAGKPAAALGPLERAAKLDPHSAQVQSNLSMTLASLNRDNEALAAAERALALAPDNVEALNNRGNILLKLDRAAEALADFERAAALDPRFLGARLS